MHSVAVSPLVCDGFLFLFFMTLIVLRRDGQVFCRMFLKLGVSDVFLTRRLGLWGFLKNTAKGKCLSHHIAEGI